MVNSKINFRPRLLNFRALWGLALISQILLRFGRFHGNSRFLASARETQFVRLILGRSSRVEWRLAGESHFVETRLFSLPINPTNHHPSSCYGNQNQAIAYNGYPSIAVQGPLPIQETHEGSDENADAKPTKFCYSKDSNGIQGRNGAHGSRRNQRSHSIGRYESWHSPSSGRALDKADAGSKVWWCVTTRTVLTSGCDTCITQNKSPSAFWLLWFLRNSWRTHEMFYD